MTSLFYILVFSISALAWGEDTPSVNPVEVFSKVRDPFKRPSFLDDQVSDARTPLEKFQTKEFKLVGVITGPDKLRGLVLDPEQMTHLVSVNDRIGVRNGKIKRILPTVIIVEEKIKNELGQEENSVVEIKYPVASKKEKKTATSTRSKLAEDLEEVQKTQQRQEQQFQKQVEGSQELNQTLKNLDQGGS